MKKRHLCTIMALSMLTAWSASAAFVAYNDAVEPLSGSAANVTHYSGNLIGGGSVTTSGHLIDVNNGSDTGVTAIMQTTTYGAYLDTTGTFPDAGTPAYAVFNGYVNLDGGVQFSNVGAPSSPFYQVIFTGLNPNHQYTFITTAYDRGVYELFGADTFTNESSGVSDPTEDSLYFRFNGDIVKWTGITSGWDGSFSVKSSAIWHTSYIDGPRTYVGNGMQGFMLADTTPVPEPTTVIAGALLLIPFGLNGVRMLRKNGKA